MKKVYILLLLVLMLSCSENSTDPNIGKPVKMTIYIHDVYGDANSRKHLEVEFDGVLNWRDRLFY